MYVLYTGASRRVENRSAAGGHEDVGLWAGIMTGLRPEGTSTMTGVRASILTGLRPVGRYHDRSTPSSLKCKFTAINASM